MSWMQACWTDKAKERPDFSQVCEILEDIVAREEEEEEKEKEGNEKTRRV